MSVITDIAFVINTARYREYGLRIDFLTLQYGRLQLLCNGSKRYSPIRSMLQPFVPLEISWKESKSLAVLVDVVQKGRAFSINVPNIFTSLYVNEILWNLYKEKTGDVRLFAQYLKLLKELSENRNIAETLRRLECFLIYSLGYTIKIDFNIQEIDANSAIYIGISDKVFLLSSKYDSYVIASINLNGVCEWSSNSYEDLSEELRRKINRIVINYLLKGKTLVSRKLYLDYLNKIK